MVNRILAHHKYDAYQKFEEISLLIKKTQLKVKNPKTSEQIRQIDESSCQKELDRYIRNLRELLNEKLCVDPSNKQFVDKNNQCAVGDFLEKTKILEWAGISFGEEETYRIYKSMCKLAKLTNAKNLRFWGKFMATKNDYYVIEGQLHENEKLEIPFGQEPRGKGVNNHVYWVTENVMNDWVELPDVNPEHIVAAKKFKKILTGNLNAAVDSNPPFPGKERHLLRAQIARIAHSTTLFPKGLLEVNEETEELQYTEDFAVPGVAELNSDEVWAHHYPNILNAGRITHQKPNLPDDQADEIMAKLEEEDKVLEKLAGVNEDAPIPPLEKSWLFKVVGDDQPYATDDGEGNVVYSANVIKSLRWPGAYTVAYDGKWSNIYIGFGLKHGVVSYNPTCPPDVMADPDESPEMPEPTPLEAPEEPLEPDTDEENKAEAEGD